MNKKKIFKKVNRKRFEPNAKYLAGRYVKEYKNQPIYIITDANGKPYDVVEGEDKALEMLKNKPMDDEVDKVFKKAVNEEEIKIIENKAKRSTTAKELAKEYKSSTEIQREKYDSAVDEYFKINDKLQKQIDAIKNKTDEYGVPINQDKDDADIITGSPQLKNLQKNKIKAMKKAWALSQSGDEDYREEALDSFGKLPGKDYGEFTPSASPGVREYSSREQKIDTSMARDLEMKKNMDVQTGSFSTKPRTREEVSKSIPKIPKKKYTDEELLRIIAGK